MLVKSIQDSFVRRIKKYSDILTVMGLNFINILRTAFTQVDPECAKKDSQASIVILRFWAPGA